MPAELHILVLENNYHLRKQKSPGIFRHLIIALLFELPNCSLSMIVQSLLDLYTYDFLRFSFPTFIAYVKLQLTCSYSHQLLAEKLPELLDFDKDLVHLEAASKVL